VEYAGGKRALRAYIAVCLQIHCNPSNSAVHCVGVRTMKSKLTMMRKPLVQTTFSHLQRQRLPQVDNWRVEQDKEVRGTSASAERRTGISQLLQQLVSWAQMTSCRRDVMLRRLSTTFVVHIVSTSAYKCLYRAASCWSTAAEYSTTLLNEMNEWKCEDFKCVWKLTESRLCLTHYVNKSSRWAK